MKIVLWGAKLAVSAGLIVWLMQRVDPAVLIAVFRQASMPMLALATAISLLQVPISGERWRQVMRGIGITTPFPLGWLVGVSWMGAFVNLLVPGAIGGDALRVWKIHKRGIALTAAVSGVLLDRIVTVLSLTIMVSLMVPLLIEDVPGRWVFQLLAVAGFAGIGGLMVLDRTPGPLRRWRIVRGFAALAVDARRLFLGPTRLLPPLVWAFVGNANLALAVFVLARGLGVDLGLFEALALVPPVVLVTSLPISISGWGTRELAMVTALGLVGVPGESAFATSVLFGLVSMAISLPGGLFWLLQPGRDEPAG